MSNKEFESKIRPMFKELTGAFPWYFKVAWVIGLLLGLSAGIGLITVIVLLIRHLW